MYPNTGKLDSADQMPASIRLPRFARHLKRFAKDESGVLLVFGVYIFILMLMMGGIGIDLMRFERDRARLQSTLDRAVLAAADLDQTLDPRAVVEDYFDKAGLSEFLLSVTVDDGLGYRVVSAVASTTVETQFMRMTGVDSLEAPATGTAEERIDGVEISLILDVSGSMGSNNRLTNLKVAARDFIDTMMDNSQEGKVSISIIPYATQVSVPDFLFDEFNVTEEHDYSRCINFTGADFNTTSMSTNNQLQRTMHFDPWSDDDGRDDDPIMDLVDNPVCEATADREIMVLQDDRNALKTFISNFHADGNTSIDIGMKWGTALLDPSLDNVVDNLIADSHISSDFSERPHAYNDGETIKVIVLMTDGENTSQYYVENGYKTGNSNIWWNEDEEKYSVYNPGNRQFYWPHADSWNDHAYGNGITSVCTGYNSYYNYCYRWEEQTEDGSALVVGYADLWAYTSLQWNLYNNYYPWMNSNSANNVWYWNVFNEITAATKDARTHSICNSAKNQGVLIYTIAFEAPYSGQVVLKDCASSVSHFFSVSGLEIANAFDAIASSIRQLRLTQ